MNFARTKSGLRQLGVLCALGGVTVLLTVLFSFLGNLSAAVVAGVMMGSTRRWHWTGIPVSLVFPAVILALSHYSKIELPPEKVHLITLVCGLAFWGVYAMMFCLHFLEQKEEAPPVNAAGRAGLEGGTSGGEGDASRGFSLALLRGNWTCENAAADGSAQIKTLLIEDGKFTLTVSVPGGRSRVVARGEVNVDPSSRDKLAVILSEHREYADGI